jgi:inorganic triphosphatase YgiF
MRELELKLEVDPEHIARLQRSAWLRSLTEGRARTRTIHSVYHDAPDLALSRRDVALRVRMDGRRRLLCVKGRGVSRGGLFDRPEIELPVEDDRPDPARLPEGELRRIVEAEAARAGLQAVFETDFRRTTRRIGWTGSEIELALDVGEIRAGGRSLPICEVELELVQGEPTQLYEIALELLSQVPLRLSTLSKAERGYGLLTGEVPAPRKALRPGLQPDALLDDVVSEVLGTCLGQVLDNQAPAYVGQDSEGVHQMRVGVRRLRSALQLFHSVLPEDEVRTLRARLGWLARELGAARDIDVFLEQQLEPLFRQRADDAALKRLRDEALGAREHSYETLRHALDSERCTRLLLETSHWIARRAWREQPLSEQSARLFAPARLTTGGLLGRLHRRMLELGEHIEDRSLAEKHALRIRAKKLRYASELLEGLYPGKRVRRLLKRLPELQDQLGHLADLQIADRLLDELLARMGDEAGPAQQRAAGFAAGWIARKAEEHTRDLERHWARIEKAAPFWAED